MTKDGKWSEVPVLFLELEAPRVNEAMVRVMNRLNGKHGFGYELVMCPRSTNEFFPLPFVKDENGSPWYGVRGAIAFVRRRLKRQREVVMEK